MKPMLAEDVVSFETLTYPLYGSFKVDGVRGLMVDQKLKPRSLKDFANKAVREFFDTHGKLLDGFDGELTLGADPAPAGVRLCNVTSSALTTIDGSPEIHWWIFDYVSDELVFEDRVRLIRKWFKDRGARQLAKMRVHMLEQHLIKSPADAMDLEAKALALGYEGIVLKSLDGRYKYGRSTLRSQQFLRVKRFDDAEGKIVGFVERQQNNNEATVNKLGHKTRSSHKANKVGAGTLGTLKVLMLNGQFKDKIIEVGTGWDAATGQQIWDNKDGMTHKIVKVRYFGHGCKDLPRFPTFQGFRDPADM